MNIGLIGVSLRNANKEVCELALIQQSTYSVKQQKN